MTEQPKISDEAVMFASRELCDDARDGEGGYMPLEAWMCEDCERDARRALEAAYPLLRQQWEKERAELDGRLSAVVAEGIAQEIEAKAEKIRQEAFTPSAGVALAAVLEEGAKLAREVGARAGRPNGTEASDA